jgi:hypothetical protein
VVRVAPDALVVLDHVLIGDLKINDVVPKPKHLPENPIFQELQISRPIDVVDQLFGGDQKKMSFAKIGSSIPAASGQLPSRKVKSFHLREYCR